MKIAYLAQTYPPMISGQAVLTQRLAAGMAARGHSVLVIAASEHGRHYVEEQANLRVVRLRSTRNPFRVGQRMLRSPWRKVYEELLRFDPDVVHLHDPLHSALAGIYALRGRQVPIVLTTHQLPWFISNFIPVPSGLQKTVDAALWSYARWLCRRCDAVVAPTQTIAAIVQKNTGCSPQVISNGMDLEAFRPERSTPDERETLCARYGLDPKLPIILHVGQLNVQKRVDVIVRAAAQVMQNTNAQLLVVGDGKERKALMHLAKKLGVQERSVFPGYITDELPGIYRLGSVFVTASEVETQGLVVLEAMASGLPVVAARATCIPEIVWEGVNGYLVPPRDVKSFALRIEQVLQDPRDMGSAGRSLAQQHTFTTTLDRHETAYARLRADRKAGSRFAGFSHPIGRETIGSSLPVNRSTNQQAPFTLFTQVRPFYEDLLNEVKAAQKQISMMYLTFESGEWGSTLAGALCERAASGVEVRLMVDDIGLMVDDPRSAFRNRWLMQQLREHGVQVDIFRPAGWQLSHWNRLHVKVCAIDRRIAFVGGSNIGDGYLRMSDHNLRLDGDLGSTFHDVYDYLRHHTRAGAGGPTPGFRPAYSFAGQAQVRLTVPGQRRDIRRALLDVILDAERAVYIRKWYFLPDREILEALCSQARNGVAVNILLSHRTPVTPINIANYLQAHELAKSGARVYRFMNGFMHAKVAWNDRGEVLFGSANMDDKALRSNFECSLVIQNNDLAEQLTLAFNADTKSSLLQTPGYFRRLPLHTKALSYAFSLARPWL